MAALNGYSGNTSKVPVHPYIKFATCVGGIYVSFMIWALCQERLSTTPYPSVDSPGQSDKFRAVVFLNTVQSAFSACSAFCFLALTKKRPGMSWRAVVGLPQTGKAKDDGPLHKVSSTGSRTAGQLIRLYAFISLVSSMASPFGFLALSHISFPTLLLGKSCKLVPVMMMNILLYRRKFPMHKYALVALVTLGIWAFMAFKPTTRPAKGPATSSALGLALLGINLLLDGVVNATQDHVFSTFKPLDGPQMMLFMNAFSTLITSVALLWPTALTPAFLAPATSATSPASINALSSALSFIASHPLVKFDMVLFGLTGAIGQLFIFVTLSAYGSLTLVTITVTRKMATMLLSVVVFDHRLGKGQWVGVAMVFGAVAMEAVIGRREKGKKKGAVVGTRSGEEKLVKQG